MLLSELGEDLGSIYIVNVFYTLCLQPVRQDTSFCFVACCYFLTNYKVVTSKVSFTVTFPFFCCCRVKALSNVQLLIKWIYAIIKVM